MSAARCTPGTVYYAIVNGEWTKVVYVGRYRLSNNEEAYIMGAPADGTGARDKEVRLVGGGEDSLSRDAGTGFVHLIAVQNLQGFRTRRPGKAIIQWAEEAAPRLDKLEEMANDVSNLPVTSGLDELMLSEIQRLRTAVGRAPTGVQRTAVDRGSYDDDWDRRAEERDDARRSRRGEAERGERRSRRRRDDSVSSSEEDGTPRRGRGSAKFRTYERLRTTQERRPRDRWMYLEQIASEAGYSGSTKVEMYLTECSKLGKSKVTSYLIAGMSRAGLAAWQGDADSAAGIIAATIGYLDQSYINGDVEGSWRTALLSDPVVVQRNATLAKTLTLPDAGKTSGPHRHKFSPLVPPAVLEASLEMQKQWAAWDQLAKAGQ